MVYAHVNDLSAKKPKIYILGFEQKKKKKKNFGKKLLLNSKNSEYITISSGFQSIFMNLLIKVNLRKKFAFYFPSKCETVMSNLDSSGF